MEQERSDLDPWSLYIYAMKAPMTRDRYKTRLAKFVDFIGIEGEAASSSLEDKARAQGLRKKLESGKKRHPYQANHSLRKWFKTRCEIAGMKPINIEKLMNHSTGISDSYYRATENELLGDYLKGAENMLRINDDKLTLQKQVVELTEKSKNDLKS